MATQHDNPTATDAEKLKAAGQLLSVMASRLSTVSTIMHGVIGGGSLDDEEDSCNLLAAAELAASAAAVADRGAAACGAGKTRGGFDEWVLSPVERAALGELEART